MHLLDWYNLIFYIPLAVGLLMALGMAVGVMDLPHGIDMDGDGQPDAWVGAEATVEHDIGHGAEHDASHDAEGHQDSGFKPLALLGFGKVPFLLVCMTMLLVFGGAGVILNMVFGKLLTATGGALALVSALAAFILMVLLTGTFSKLVSRFMPTLETNSTSKGDLVGCTGTVTLAFDTHKGVAQIRRDGDLYQIQYTSSEKVTKGQSVLITSWDSESKMYDVSADPRTA